MFPIRVYAGGALLDREPAQHTYTTAFFPLDLYKRDRRRAALLSESLPPGQTLQEAAVRFALEHRATSAAILGFSEPTHVDEAVAALGGGQEAHRARV